MHAIEIKDNHRYLQKKFTSVIHWKLERYVLTECTLRNDAKVVQSIVLATHTGT